MTVRAAQAVPRAHTTPPAHLLEGRDLRTLVFRAAIVLAVLYGIVVVDGFATSSNVRALLSSIAYVGIAAVGMAFVTISGNLFILSVGSTIASGTVLFASLTASMPVPAAIAITLLAGLCAGLLQGLVVGRLKGDPIITTIAAAALVLGVGQLIAAGKTVVADGDLSPLRADLFGIVPVEGACLIAIAIVAHEVLRRTSFGHWVKLTGENRDTALVTGIPVARVIVATYAIAGLCAAIPAVLLAAQAGQGTLEIGIGTDFDAIAAILVGGVLVTGGRGSIADVALGALFIGLVANLLAVSGHSYETQLLVKGVIVLIAVSVAGLGARMRSAGA